MRLKKLIRTGACIEDLWEFGFEGKKEFDTEENVIYYKLYLNGEEVGYTEINEVNGDVEIICESKEGHDKVKEVVGEVITVWAWYNNAFTNNN